MIARAILAGLGVLMAVPASAAPPDGAAVFTRCAACHTRTGQGVPGAYPPLNVDFRTQATSPAGRRYLVLAVTRGLMGPLTVEGKAYAGVMPAQSGLDDAAVAAVLNHVGTQITRSGPTFKPFSETEVRTLRASGTSLSSAEVAKLHVGANGK